MELCSLRELDLELSSIKQLPVHGLTSLTSLNLYRCVWTGCGSVQHVRACLPSSSSVQVLYRDTSCQHGHAQPA